jgi:hypothetical protein
MSTDDQGNEQRKERPEPMATAHRLRRLRRLAAIVTLLALVLVTHAAGPASSAGNDEFSVQPSAPAGTEHRPWFIYEMQPGQIFQDSVDVENFSENELTLAFYASDGFTLPGGGGFAALNEGEDVTGAGTWLTLPVDGVTLGPLEGATIPFQIKVPIDAEPGDHAAVILASDPVGNESDEGDEDSPINIAVRNRVGTRIYVRVTGPLEPSLRVDDITIVHDRSINPLTEGTATITYVVSNTGNIRLSEDIQVKVKGLFGRTVKTLEPRNFPDVLPDGAIVVTEIVEGLNPWEPLSVEVSAVARETSTSRSTTFYPVPWPTVILLLLAISLFAAWLWLRRREGDDDDIEPADDASGESGGELIGSAT